MDFKSFKNSTNKNTDKSEYFDENDIKRTAQNYQGKSDGELLGDIFKMANEQKANGNLSDEKLKAFADSVSPMLNAEQRARLNGVLEMLKDNKLKP